jgi:hypothetical protein
MCGGGRWNPLNYETIGIGGEFDLKIIGGIEASFSILTETEPFRNLHPLDANEAGLFISFEGSVGASFETGAVGGKITGTDGGVLDQLGVSGTANGVGCAFGFCAGTGGEYDFQERRFSSVEYFGGTGTTGVDIGAGLTYTDMAIYINREKNVLAFKLPLIPKVWTVNLR